LEADESTSPAENIDEVITNHLVLFRSIPALQGQNQKLLGIVREMGAKMEAEEREYREALEKEQGEAVREAHEAITALQEQLEAQRRTHDVKMQAFIKERDSLKVLLGRAERGSAGKDARSQANGAATESDIAKELAEIQQQFDTYRAETGVDSVRLREDAVAAQREVAQLIAQGAKANARLEIAGGMSHPARFSWGIVLMGKRCRPLQDVTGATGTHPTGPGRSDEAQPRLVRAFHGRGH
jgi:nucleoprotein TPR